ncbi:MAG: enoyl-CoA hydratase/isomerase family protein [Chloroflexi bacterium]|nr:enoyl-CoA hydratase/isomerase family protein [Chloroflexota bacterium]
MAYKNIIYQRELPLAVLTFNRPEVRNALSYDLIQESIEAVREAERDDEVRVLIVTGAGDRAFVAGADIAEMQTRNLVTELGPRSGERRVLNTLLENLGKPTIAAINGFALGGGCEIAMSCTLRVASNTARFGQPEINLGLIPGNGGTQRLPRLIGKTKAMELILLGEMIDAEEAYRLGLVNRVVPLAELMNVAREMALKLAGKPPIAVRLAKEAVNAADKLGLPEGLEFEAKAYALLYGTQDKEEGVRAFLEKRPAQFKGL